MEKLQVVVGDPSLITKHGKPVAVVVVDRAEVDALAVRIAELMERIKGEGYRVEKAVANAQAQTFELGGECEVERPRTCELEITLGRIEELAEEAGVPSTEVDALAAKPFTEEEAKVAARTVIDRIPSGAAREDAETWYQVCFEGAGGDG